LLTEPTPESQGSSRNRNRRTAILIIVGVLFIGAALAFRNGAWAKQRRLERLTTDELQLASVDSPNDPLTVLYLAQSLMKDQRYAEALPSFERAVKLNPDSATAHFGLGSSLFKAGRLKPASESFQKAIKLDPKLPDAYLGLAQVYYSAGSSKLAIDPMKKLTELQPKSAIAWFTLGQLYGDSHMSDLAMEAMSKATQLDPNKPIYWRSLARLSQHYSRLDEAEAQYKKCLKLDPNDAIAYLWLGELYLAKGDSPQHRGAAEDTLNRAISRQPDLAEAYFALGQLYERKKLWDLATLNFRKAHQFDSSNDRALYHLGVCLVKQGKTAEGDKLIAAAGELGSVSRQIKNLENQCALEPQNRSIVLRLARLYRKYGNEDGARNKYIEYMRMGVADPTVEKEIDSYRSQLEKQKAKLKPANSPAESAQAKN
jgi:superkiller protein 3